MTELEPAAVQSHSSIVQERRRKVIVAPKGKLYIHKVYIISLFNEESCVMHHNLQFLPYRLAQG